MKLEDMEIYNIPMEIGDEILFSANHYQSQSITGSYYQSRQISINHY